MNETMNPSRCPSPAQLRAFAVGNLGDADIDRIADHVLDCEPCDRALRSLDGMADGLLRSLEGFNGADVRPSVPLPETLLRVAQIAGRASCGQSCPDVSLDSPRRLSLMLVAGSRRLRRYAL